LERLRANLSWKPAHCYRAMQPRRAPEPARSTHVSGSRGDGYCAFPREPIRRQSGLCGDGNAATTKSSQYSSGNDGGSGDAGKTRDRAKKLRAIIGIGFDTKHFKNETPAVSSRRGREDVGRSLSTGRYAGMTPFGRFCCKSRMQGIGSFGLLLGAAALSRRP
jgi:hypothetical protein